MTVAGLLLTPGFGGTRDSPAAGRRREGRRPAARAAARPPEDRGPGDRGGPGAGRGVRVVAGRRHRGPGARRPLVRRPHVLDGRRGRVCPPPAWSCSPTRCTRRAARTQLRTAHLPDIRVPVLAVSGTTDPFGSPDELTAPPGRDPGPGHHRLPARARTSRRAHAAVADRGPRLADQRSHCRVRTSFRPAERTPHASAPAGSRQRPAGPADGPRPVPGRRQSSRAARRRRRSARSSSASRRHDRGGPRRAPPGRARRTPRATIDAPDVTRQIENGDEHYEPACSTSTHPEAVRARVDTSQPGNAFMRPTQKRRRDDEPWRHEPATTTPVQRMRRAVQ